MNYLQSFYPIVKKDKEDSWVFCVNNLYKPPDLESNSIDDGKYVKFEPFVFDDISLDLSKIPMYTISEGDLKCVNIRGEDFNKDKADKQLECPYKPIEKDNESEKEEKKVEEEEEDKSDNAQTGNKTSDSNSDSDNGSDSNNDNNSNSNSDNDSDSNSKKNPKKQNAKKPSPKAKPKASSGTKPKASSGTKPKASPGTKPKARKKGGKKK